MGTTTIAVERGRAVQIAAGVGGLVLFAACTAAGAQLRVRLPFSPVPVTAQTLFVLLSGALLGRKLGPGSQALYGLLALVWPGAIAGPIHATAGYLVGFVAAAHVVGRLVGESCSFWRAAGAMAVGSLVIYLLGVAWLVGVTGSLGAAVTQGVVPFLPGDALKVLAAASVTAGGRRMQRVARREPGPFRRGHTQQP